MTSQNETPACQQDVSIATQQPLSIAMLVRMEAVYRDRFSRVIMPVS